MYARSPEANKLLNFPLIWFCAALLHLMYPMRLAPLQQREGRASRAREGFVCAADAWSILL